MLKPVSFCSWSTYVNAGLPLFLAPRFGSQSTRVVIISFNWSRYHYVTQSGAQGPEEMCLSLEHQNASKTSEKWVILIALTIALQFRYTFCIPQTKRLRARKIGLQYKIRKVLSFTRHFVPRSPFGRRAVRQRGYGLRLLIFKMANNKVDLGQIRSEEIVYSRFIKIPLG